MKALRVVLVLLCCSLIFPAAAPAQDGNAEMEAWIKAATPGAAHAELAAMEGMWTYTSKMWMDPTADPMESRGTSKKHMLLGGRFLAEESDGNMMGMAFNGMGITGYNNVTNQYEAYWIDSMGTGMTLLKGPKSGNKITMTGEYADPSGMTMKIQAVTTLTDADHYTFEYMVDMGGTFTKVMELNYTRGAGKGAKPEKAAKEKKEDTGGGW